MIWVCGRWLGDDGGDSTGLGEMRFYWGVDFPIIVPSSPLSSTSHAWSKVVVRVTTASLITPGVASDTTEQLIDQGDEKQVIKFSLSIFYFLSLSIYLFIYLSIFLSLSFFPLSFTKL